MDYDYTSEQH